MIKSWMYKRYLFNHGLKLYSFFSISAVLNFPEVVQLWNEKESIEAEYCFSGNLSDLSECFKSGWYITIVPIQNGSWPLIADRELKWCLIHNISSLLTTWQGGNTFGSVRLFVWVFETYVVHHLVIPSRSFFSVNRHVTIVSHSYRIPNSAKVHHQWIFMV